MAAPVTAAEVCRNLLLLSFVFTVLPPERWDSVALMGDDLMSEMAPPLHGRTRPA
jgi:hypothetical protein